MNSGMGRGKDRGRKERDKPKESEFKKFAKKRAPIYLAVAAIVVVFIVPELTKGTLESHLPEDLAGGERQVLDALMNYRGPDGQGLSVMEALSEKISEDYPGENVFDNKKTAVDVAVVDAGPGLDRILLNFTSAKGQTEYSWDVDAATGEVAGNNSASKHIVDLVDFYD